MKKSQYDHFKGIYLSEKAFRECWGKEYEDLIERRNGLIKTRHTLLARRLDVELNMLARVFDSLGAFREEPK